MRSKLVIFFSLQRRSYAQSVRSRISCSQRAVPLSTIDVYSLNGHRHNIRNRKTNTDREKDRGSERARARTPCVYVISIPNNRSRCRIRTIAFAYMKHSQYKSSHRPLSPIDNETTAKPEGTIVDLALHQFRQSIQIKKFQVILEFFNSEAGHSGFVVIVALFFRSTQCL